MNGLSQKWHKGCLSNNVLSIDISSNDILSNDVLSNSISSNDVASNNISSMMGILMMSSKNYFNLMKPFLFLYLVCK
jgi:hypothetical protein